MTTLSTHPGSGRKARLAPGRALARAGALAGAAVLLVACTDYPTSPASPPDLDGPFAASANTAQHTSAIVTTHPSLGPVVPVAGASARLVSNNNGVSVTMHTGDLIPGHAYTAWWVKIDEPENCATSPCTGADVLRNVAGVKSNVAHAAGKVAGASGRATFATHFSTGPVPGGWFANEFTNPRGAEIHLIIMDHGPALPGLVWNQISTFRGGCSDQSVNTAPLAGFPDVAKEDGVPGPNTCRLVQVTILQQ